MYGAQHHARPTPRAECTDGRTPETGKRLARPNSESVGLQSSSAGVRSRGLVLLGSLHVELSSWGRGNHPPLQPHAPPPVPVDWVGVWYNLPQPRKRNKTREPPTPAAVRPATCPRTGRREARSVLEGHGGSPPTPRIELSQSPRAQFHLLREQGFSFAGGPMQRGHLNGS